MEIDSFVVVFLHSPRERWWGLLRALTSAGVTLRGLPLDSFEPWVRRAGHGETADITPSTVFFPMGRVERIYADEAAAGVPSHAEKVAELTGIDARAALLGKDGPVQ